MSEDAQIHYASDIVVRVRHNAAVRVEMSEQGPQGPAGDITAEMVAALGQAQYAYQQAQAAETGAKAAEQGAVTARAGANAERVAAETARAGANAERVASETSRQASEVARQGSEVARTGAQTARTGAEAARDSVQGMANSLDTVRNETITARDTALGAQTGAQTAQQLAGQSEQATAALRDEVLEALDDTETARDQTFAARDAAQQTASASITLQPTPAAGTSINTIIANGIYFFPTAANVTTALGFPSSSRTGRLVVMANDAKIIQEYTDDTAVNCWLRVSTNSGSSWASWGQAYNSVTLAAVSQTDAQAGTSTTTRRWSPLDVRRNVTAYASPLGHTHVAADITDLQTLLDAKSDVGHQHAISDVTGLDAALSARLPLVGGTMTGSLVVRDGTMGFAKLLSGSATQAGRIEFATADDVRRGFIGHKGAANNLVLNADNGWGWEVVGTSLFSGNVSLADNVSLSLGSATRQMLNLHGTSYALGVQASTAYLRTGGNFAVFANGVHSNTALDAGSGGTLLFNVSSGEIKFKGSDIFHAGSALNAIPGRLVKGLSMGDNLVFNGGFEEGSDKWSLNSVGTIVNDTTASPEGERFLRMTKSGSPVAHQDYIPVVPGQVYSLTMLVRADAASSVGSYVRVFWYKANKTGSSVIGTSDAYNNGALTTSWVRVGGRITAPSDAAYAVVNMYHTASSTATTMDVDSVRLNRTFDALDFPLTFAFAGTPTAPTPATADNSLRIATTAHVQANAALKASLTGATFTGGISSPSITATGAGGQVATQHRDLATRSSIFYGNAGNTYLFDTTIGNMAIFASGSAHLVPAGPGNLAWGNGGATLGNDGNLYMPWAGKYLSAALTEKAGVEETRDMQITKAGAQLILHYPGVKRTGLFLDGAGNLIFRDPDSGQAHFYVSSGGALYTQQLGDLNTRIEDRAYAWAEAKRVEGYNQAVALHNAQQGDVNERVHRIQFAGRSEWDNQGRVAEFPTVLCDAWWNGISVVRRASTLQMHIPAQGGWVNVSS
jgi:hypothetical protein